MPDAKIYCVSERSSLQSLLKQYNIIRAKQYAVAIDEATPLKREIARLQVTASILLKDYSIIRGLPQKIGEAPDDWATIIADAKDETIQSEAQKQYDDFREQHSWDTIQLDELLLTMSSLACICEENTEKLSKKLAELEKKASRDSGTNDFGDSTGGKDGRTNTTGQSSENRRLHNFYFNTASKDRTDHDSSDSNRRQSSRNEDDTEDVGPQFDPRRGCRFYRGIEVEDSRPEADADKSAHPAPLQLHDLPCPKFDGRITEFYTFRDRFLKFVDDPARSMQEADKMHFLLSQLTGKPLDRCSGFPISTKSYYQILDMLADEYDHPEEVMEVLMHRLRSLKPPKENRHELNEFHCEATRIIRQLEEMGIETNTYEIMRTIQSRLPRVLTRDDFETLLIGAESTVNSRPLTYVSDATHELRIIRPKDFLTPMSADEHPMDALLPPVDESGDDADYYARGATSTRDRVLAILQQSDDKLQRFWRIWRDDYLASLRERGYASRPRRNGSTHRHPRLGDIVLVFDDTVPRSCWKLARIIDLVKDSADQVPTAHIRFANRYEAHRAINHLYPLELSAQDVDDSPAQLPMSLLRSRSSPGGFGPLTGLEEEAPENPDAEVAEVNVEHETDAPIATRTRRRVATTKLAHWPQVLFNAGMDSMQTSRSVLIKDDLASRL